MKAVHPVHHRTTPKAQQKREKEGTRLEDKSGTLGLLVTTKLEVLASLEGELDNVSICSTGADHCDVPVPWSCTVCTLDGERPS